MRKCSFILAVFVAGLIGSEATQAGQIEVKRGQCPTNYHQSGAYCSQNNPSFETRSRCDVQPKTGQCPTSYSQSGGYCLRCDQEN